MALAQRLPYNRPEPPNRQRVIATPRGYARLDTQGDLPIMSSLVAEFIGTFRRVPTGGAAITGLVCPPVFLEGDRREPPVTERISSR